MNPIGLTRAEEAKELATISSKREPAPAGALGCRIIATGPEGKACGAAAVSFVVWLDGDRTPACAECAANMQVMAPGSIVRLEPLVQPARCA
jgi:hypothetical protein